MARSRARASRSWSWWSTSIPDSPSAVSSPSAGSSGCSAERPHGWAITLTPPASATTRSMPTSGTAYRSAYAGRPAAQEPRERLVAVADHAERDQGVGHVRAAAGRGAGGDPAHVGLGDARPRSPEAARPSPGPGRCARPAPRAAPPPAAGTSGRAGRPAGARPGPSCRVLISIPRTSSTPTSTAAAARLGPSVRGVVVGDRQHVEPRGRGGAHQVGRRLGAVAGQRVRVEVDAHLPHSRRPHPGTPTPRAHQGGVGPPNGSSTSGGPRPETSRRIQSSRSSSIAEAGRITNHSQRPAASPATTERSHSPRPELVETGHSGTAWLAICTRTAGGPSPMSAPRVVVDACRRSGRPPGAGLLGDDEHVHRPVQLAGARAAGQRRHGPPGVADVPEVGDPPARAQRPGQVGRERRAWPRGARRSRRRRSARPAASSGGETVPCSGHDHTPSGAV